MPQIDDLRKLVEEWDGQVARLAKATADRDRAIGELDQQAKALLERDTLLKASEGHVAELLRELEELKTPKPAADPTTEYVFRDDFMQSPKDKRDGGPYLLDAPPGVFTLMMEAGGVPFLRVQCRSDQRLDQNGTRRRSELGLPEPGATARLFRRDRFGLERWYALSLRFPDTFKDESKVVVWQHHGASADKGENPAFPADDSSRNPPLSLEWHSDKRVLRWVRAPILDVTPALPRAILWENEDGPIEPAKWYRFVVHAVWDWRPTFALTRIWLDGSPIVELEGTPNAFNDEEGWTFARFGCYWPQATKEGAYPAPRTHLIDLRDLRLGDERHQLGDFT